MKKGKLWWFLKTILSFFVIVLIGIFLPVKSYASESEYSVELSDEAACFRDYDAEVAIKIEESAEHVSSFTIDESEESTGSFSLDAYLKDIEKHVEEVEDRIYIKAVADYSEQPYRVMFQLGLIMASFLLAQTAFIGFSKERTVETNTTEESIEIIKDNESVSNPSLIMPVSKHDFFQTAITKLNILSKNESVYRTTPVLFAVEKIRRWIVTKSTLF